MVEKKKSKTFWIKGRYGTKWSVKAHTKKEALEKLRKKLPQHLHYLLR